MFRFWALAIRGNRTILYADTADLVEGGKTVRERGYLEELRTEGWEAQGRGICHHRKKSAGYDILQVLPSLLDAQRPFVCATLEQSLTSELSIEGIREQNFSAQRSA